MSKKPGGHGSAARILFGILFMYFLYFIMILPPLLATFVLATDPSTLTLCCVIPALIGIILLLFNYAFLGEWQLHFDLGVYDSRNPIKRVFSSVCGFIGSLIRPFPIKIYGANKKKYLLFAVVLPLAVIGVGCIVAGGITGYMAFFLYSGIIAVVHALFVLSIKKCPKCGCVMSGKIDYETLSSHAENYTKERSREVGSIDLGEAGSATVYEHYDVEYQGQRVFYAKIFSCLNCGATRQGRKFFVSERALDDKY